MGHRKLSTTFFVTFMKGKSILIIEVLHQESVHRCRLGSLLNLFWIFEYITSGPFGGPLHASFPDVRKVQQRLLTICILNFEPKANRKLWKYILQNTFFSLFWLTGFQVMAD